MPFYRKPSQHRSLPQPEQTGFTDRVQKPIQTGLTDRFQKPLLTGLAERLQKPLLTGLAERLQKPLLTGLAERLQKPLQAKFFRLSPGEKANRETVRFMREVAQNRASHPYIQQITREILQNVPSHDYAMEALRLGEWVRRHIRYQRDVAGVEVLTDPLTLVDQALAGRAAGDCDDMSLLLATLLLSAGHSPFFRIVKYEDPKGPFNHIYVVVYERDQGGPRRRIVLDAILKDRIMGTEVPHVAGEEIPVAGA